MDEFDIKYHRGKTKELREEIKRLEGQLATHKRKIKELDVKGALKRKKNEFKRKMYLKSTRQNMVVSALRSLGRASTAGDICKIINDEFKLKCHNSEFSTMFKTYIMDDPRISIKKINASKYEYSLNEWSKA